MVTTTIQDRAGADALGVRLRLRQAIVIGEPSCGASAMAVTSARALQAALPHVPQHGFTLAAIHAGVSDSISQYGGAHGTTKGRTSPAAAAAAADGIDVETLFASPAEATRALLRAFDTESTGEATPCAHAAGKALSQRQDDARAWRDAIQRIETKLQQSDTIRDHLVEVRGVAAVCVRGAWLGGD